MNKVSTKNVLENHCIGAILKLHAQKYSNNYINTIKYA